MSRRTGIVALALFITPASTNAQLLPVDGPTRYVYRGYLGVGQEWGGPTGSWTFTFDHIATDLWSWMVHVAQSGATGRAPWGNGIEQSEYFLTGAVMHFPIGYISGFPLSGNGCSIIGLAVEAGASGIWSTAGCDIPHIPKPRGWYPGSPDWVVPPIEYASSSTWEIEGFGTAATRNCCNVLHLVSTTVLPEPVSILLVGSGLLLVAIARYRHSRIRSKSRVVER